jgi:hypothetical protein
VLSALRESEYRCLQGRFISGSSRHEIYEIHRGGLHCALRIQPASADAYWNAGIVSGWRIIKALNGAVNGIPGLTHS